MKVNHDRVDSKESDMLKGQWPVEEVQEQRKQSERHVEDMDSANLEVDVISRSIAC